MKIIKQSYHLVGFIILMLCCSANAYSEIVIVVNAANESALTQEDIKKIYLAKKRTFPNENPVAMLDQQAGSTIKQQCC